MECERRSIDVRIDVEYYFDSESNNWGFVVPSLHIIGGADTRDEAEQRAVDAIAFALEGDAPLAPEPDSEVGHVWVTVHR